MSLFNLDLLGVAMQRMRHSATRQQVIAENIANADTPDQKARDIAGFSFGRELERIRQGRSGTTATDPGMLLQTRAGHIGTPTERGFDSKNPAESWEILPGGNAVELEQQMLAMTETKLQYDQAAAYYGKTADLLRAAASARF